MEKEIVFKAKMSYEEMSEAFALENPWLTPNRTNIGIFARKNGYTRMQQMTNRKINVFYLNKDKL